MQMTEAAGFPDSTPVLIVGGGPVGLGLAIELGWRGIPCLLVEQSDGGFDLPRANAVDLRTMEFCRRWGIADGVRAAGMPADFPHSALYVTSLAGFEIARFERRGHGGAGGLDVSPERPQRCNQLFFDPILRAHARGLAGVDLRFSARFDGFAQDEEGVMAALTDLATGRTHRVRARYLAACCGGRSPVRAALGAPLGDHGVLGHPVSIFFRAEKLWTRHDKGKASLNFIVGPDGVWGTLIPLDGRALWRLTLHGGAQPVDPDSIDADAHVRRALGIDAPYELLSVGGWTRRETVADRYRYGRVFLAGDCAHQNTPTGGYGMNTGMGDAVDLGWKLAAVLDGWGGDGLLDGYEAERRPVALRNVAEATANFRRRDWTPGPRVAEETAEGAAVRAALRRRIEDDNARQHRGHGIALGHIHAGSPLCADEEEGPVPDTVRDYAQTARPGARAPHLALGDGRSVLDSFGRGFILLRLGPGAADPSPLTAAARKAGVPLSTVDVPDPAALALYERALCLVRPDGVVAWRGDAAPEDAAALIDRVRGARI
jgi:2-polyprenyl-6-methoxyphenol hydroxylase-like FAD-dependent oxidoreductase